MKDDTLCAFAWALFRESTTEIKLASVVITKGFLVVTAWLLRSMCYGLGTGTAFTLVQDTAVCSCDLQQRP